MTECVRYDGISESNGATMSLIQQKIETITGATGTADTVLYSVPILSLQRWKDVTRGEQVEA